MPTTTDLSEFGYRELKMAGELLTAYTSQGAPDDFEEDGVTVMMNTNSGSVFLTNSEYQVCLMNGDKLESWYNCPNCGHEGFKEDMGHGEDDPDCLRYLIEAELIEGKECPDCGDNAVFPSPKNIYDWECRSCEEEGWNDTEGNPVSNGVDEYEQAETEVAGAV